MCFSPQGDLIGGLAVTGIGLEASRHLHGRSTHFLLAGTPFLLGLHQLDESVVWWSLQGDLPHELGRVATWIYLLIALVAVPVVVPLSVLSIEPTRKRKRLIVPFAALGLTVGLVLFLTMLHGPVTVQLGSHHLAYSVGLRDGMVWVGLYVLATCGALLFSGYGHVAIFGVVNLVAVIVLARMTADGFISLWCFYAAVASAAISLHLRFGPSHRARPYALS